MQRRELNFLVDWSLLAAASVAFSTGIAMLLRLHMGREACAAEALGVSRGVWLNVHRLSAIVTASGIAAHASLHWPAVRARISSLVRRKRKNPVDPELLLYAAFLVSAVSAVVAWTASDGSVRSVHVWHHWIDAHHISSLVLLALAAHHAGHRWRFMSRYRPRPVSGTPPSR